MPYSCRNSNEYKSAYKMGMSTTRELCGLCLDSVIQEKGRRRAARCSSSSSASALSCTNYARQQLCGCRSRSSSQGKSRHSTALLSAAGAIVDSLCNAGVASTADHKVHSSNSQGSSHRSKHTKSPDARSRLDNSTASSGIDPKNSNGSSKNRDKRQGRSTPTHSLAVIEYKRDQHPGLQDDTFTDVHTDRASRATFDTIETDAATYEKKKDKNSLTIALDGVSNSQSNINHVSTQQSQQESTRNVIDLSTHAKKGTKGATDSVSQNSQKSLFDDNSSTISILSSQDETRTGNGEKREHDTISGKGQITQFLHKLSQDKVTRGFARESSYPPVEEAPSNLPPLRFDSPHDNPTSTDRSLGDDSRDDASNDNPYSRPIPICSRIHHFGKQQEDSCLIDKMDSSKPKDEIMTGRTELDPAQTDDEDEEDDITGPRLARSGTLETLDTTADYVDTDEKDTHSAIVMPCTSTKSVTSTATPAVSNIRNPKNRIATPRYSQDTPAPFSPKSRKELYVVKERLQLTQNKLEATQYELTVLKGIKDLYQRELECKALECKLAEWRLSHKPLAIVAAPTALTSVASAAEESNVTSTSGDHSTTSSHGAPRSGSSCLGPSKAIAAGPQTAMDWKTDQATLPTHQSNGKYIRITITSTVVGVVLVLVWQYYSEIAALTRYCSRELCKAALGHPVVLAAIKGGHLAEAWKLLQSSARRKIMVYGEATRTFLALLYWMVRGIIWYTTDVDINDFGLLLKHVASELHESAIVVALLLARVPGTALENLSTTALNAVVR